MQEAFLHFIWKFKIFNMNDLETAAGENVQILKTGMHNFNAGPDFLHAKIMLGDTVWAGHVEIHIKATHWQAHNHSNDEAYNNVILHVVYIDDRKNTLIPAIPTIELKNRIPGNAIALYDNFLQNKLWIPCMQQLPESDEFTRNMWLERMLYDRLECKSRLINNLLQASHNNWEQTAYIWLSKSFGFKTNTAAFVELASRTPFLLLAKHSNNQQHLEALLFGQAGFLGADEHVDDEYYNRLRIDYNFLAKKYNLTPMQPASWKFMRMHPGNFPTVRIAQLAALLYKHNHLLSNLLKIKDLPGGLSFLTVETSNYWQRHSHFGRQTAKKSSGKIGTESIYNLLINTVVPLQFCYGELRSKPQLKEQAQKLLSELPPENNNITRGWTQLGIENKTAADSQALIQLKNHYCNEKLCLTCAIGTSILRKTSN